MAKYKFKMFCNTIFGYTPSDYGIKNDRLDFLTLSKIVGNKVMSNFIINCVRDWELENGDLYDEDGNPEEVYQWFIISDTGAEILKDYTDEIVLYSDELCNYIWGITHYGTAWDYVLTEFKLSDMVDPDIE